MVPDIALNLAEYSMRLSFLALTLGCALVVSNTAAGAQSMVDGPTTVPGGAPIGHLQPRAQQFAPLSAADQAEQGDVEFRCPAAEAGRAARQAPQYLPGVEACGPR